MVILCGSYYAEWTVARAEIHTFHKNRCHFFNVWCLITKGRPLVINWCFIALSITCACFPWSHRQFPNCVAVTNVCRQNKSSEDTVMLHCSAGISFKITVWMARSRLSLSSERWKAMMIFCNIWRSSAIISVECNKLFGVKCFTSLW